MISEGLSIYQVPASFDWLGRGDALFSIPIAVVLMVLLYIVAHFVMSRTTAGRYIYAVGGNQEAVGCQVFGSRFFFGFTLFQVLLPDWVVWLWLPSSEAGSKIRSDV